MIDSFCALTFTNPTFSLRSISPELSNLLLIKISSNFKILSFEFQEKFPSKLLLNSFPFNFSFIIKLEFNDTLPLDTTISDDILLSLTSILLPLNLRLNELLPETVAKMFLKILLLSANLLLLNFNSADNFFKLNFCLKSYSKLRFISFKLPALNFSL